MLGFFKRKLKKGIHVAVYSDDSSVSVAQVRRENDLPPTLEFCDVQDAQNISIRDAVLSKLTKTHNLDQYQCLSLMQLGDYHLLLVEAPDVEPDEVKAAIRFRIKELIDFDLKEAVVDVFEAPVGRSASRANMVYAVVARSKRIKALISQLKSAGLNLETIDIPELALRNIAAMLPEDVAGVALVYIDENQGLITITRQDELYLSRTIAGGHSMLPEAVLSVVDDEDCRRWLDNIVIEVQRSMDYYESHFGQPQVSALVLSPLDHEVPGMIEYLEEQLQIPARFLDIQELIDVSEPLSRYTQSRCLLALGTALRQDAQVT
ncbi:MAG: hypothetical protein RLT87_06980 [Gammaproteobacteria bacterium]